MLNVSVATTKRAKVVIDEGAPELVEAEARERMLAGKPQDPSANWR